MVLFLLGVALMVALVIGPLTIFGAVLDVHSMLVSLAAIVLGTQIVLSFVLANQYATSQGVLPASERFARLLAAGSLERMVGGGGVLVVAGLAGVVTSAVIWARKDFGDLDVSQMMRLLIPAVTALIVGVQLAAAGFVSSILELKGGPRRAGGPSASGDST